MKLRNITKSFNEEVVLNDINLNIDTTGLYIIYGESGQGKSTLFNIISNRLSFDSGEITYENSSVSYCSSDNQLIEILTPNDSFKLVSKDKELIKKYIKLLSLNKVKNKANYKLSSGERQRCQIILTLLSSSNTLLFDEPTSNLDTKTSKIVFELLKEESRKRAIILISHDLSSINFANYIYHLENHILVEEKNEPQELLKDSETKIFNKSGLLNYSIKSKKYHIVLGIINLLLLLAIMTSFTLFFGYLLVNPKDNAISISDNLKYDYIYGGSTYSNDEVINTYNGYNYLKLRNFDYDVTAIYYEDIKEKYNLGEDLTLDDCYISSDFVEYLKAKKNIRVQTGSMLKFNYIGNFQINFNFVVKGVYESTVFKTNKKNTIVISKQFYYDVKDTFGIVDEESLDNEINSYLDSYNFSFDVLSRLLSHCNYVKNYNIIELIEQKNVSKDYNGYVHLGSYPQNENEIMISNYRLYIAMTNDRGSGLINNYFSDEEDYQYFGINNTIYGKLFKKLLDNNYIDHVKIVGCIFKYEDEYLCDDGSIYVTNDLYTKFEKNVNNDDYNMFKTGYYFDKDVIKNYYKEILDDKIGVNIQNEYIINYQIIKNMLIVSSVVFAILFIFRSIYQSVIYDNLSEDFSKLASLDAKPRDFMNILLYSSLLSFIVMIIGIVLGFIALKYTFKMQTSEFSYGGWVTNDAIVVLFDLIMALLLIALSFIPYFIKYRKREK